MSDTPNETDKFYKDLSFAFDHYNRALFENSLPTILFSIRAKANSPGYFSPDRLAQASKKSNKLHEIALNPIIFDRGVLEIFSTLVHEMAHLWQKEHGSSSKNGYHNSEFAEKMLTIGLPSSDTGEPGGKPTGSKMLDYIEKGGMFEKATAILIKSYTFDFYFEPPLPKKEKTNSKVKYTCPLCKANAWGKPDLEIDCRPCGGQMEGDE